MRHQTTLLFFALLASTAVFAQSQSPADTNHVGPLAMPATTASTATPPTTSSDVHKRLPFQADAKPSPFKFKDQKHHSGVADRPPPSANDKAAVMGTQRPWQNGRAPVDCRTSPHAAGC